jgi:hypothetical protein
MLRSGRLGTVVSTPMAHFDVVDGDFDFDLAILSVALGARRNVAEAVLTEELFENIVVKLIDLLE